MFLAVDDMEVELCMIYADCKWCPQNRVCEEEYNKEMEQKSGDTDGHGNMQILWDSSKGSSMPSQKEPGKTRGQAK